MKLAWEQARRVPVTAADLEWRTLPVALPHRGPNDAAALHRTIADTAAPERQRLRAARDLTWLERVRGGRKIDLALLRLGPARVVHMPGELFVEYQIAAQKLRPADFVAMAAYGDYGPGYIGTAVAYTQGGYETGPVSRTAPEVEDVLMSALRRLLAR
jgi:hypothetical protein